MRSAHAIPAPDILSCPICRSTLAAAGKALRCPNGHAYDVTREGYVNLLARQRPGDTKAMLDARRRFLERGHYDALSDAINEAVEGHVWTALRGGAGPRAHVLDSGCGEGYYLGRLMERLDATGEGARCSYLGVDSSKDAARMAARRYPRAFFAVADVWDRIPVVDGSLDVLLDVFAPRNPTEFARVLKPGGLLLIAIPGPGHLLELRRALPLLGIQEGKENHVRRQLSGAFALHDTRRIGHELAFQADDVEALVQMTPSAFHAGRRDLGSPREVAPVATRADFALLLFGRTGGRAA